MTEPLPPSNDTDENMNDVDDYGSHQSMSDESVSHSSRTSSVANEPFSYSYPRITIFSTSESSSLASSFPNEELSDYHVSLSDFTTPGPSYDQQSTLSTENRVEWLFFKRVIERCPSLMKIHGASQFAKEVCDLCKVDQDIQTQWQQTIDFYKNVRSCDNNERMEIELAECLNALVSDERGIMIGLDSISSLKDVLITCMRIATKSDLKLKIRIVLGGTKVPPNLRIPAYAVAGIDRLQQLMALREKFAPASSLPLLGTVPTTMLLHAPVLSFFSSHTAAVQVNNLDMNIGEKYAHEMLSYIKMYVTKYHPSLMKYIRYEMDHSNTYEPQLLDHFTQLCISNCQDKKTQQVMQALAKHAENHGSSENGHIRYASMHLIMFDDVIDTYCSNSLVHSLNNDESNVEHDALMSLPDCIISIGGSVEKQFNEVRHLVRDAFCNGQDINTQGRYHYPLSVRMLSRAGQTPVYYCHVTHEIPVARLLNGNMINLNQTDKAAKPVNEDLSILKEDIGISILKPIWELIPDLKPSDISSWKSIVSTLIELCLKTWRVHARDRSQTCKCPTQNITALDQILVHWQLSNVLNNDGRSILQSILEIIERKISCHFGTPNTRSRSGTICVNSQTTNNIMAELDNVLNQILIVFVRTVFPLNENDE